MDFEKMAMMSSPIAISAGLCNMADGEGDPPGGGPGGAADLVNADPTSADPKPGDPPADPKAGDPPADPDWLKEFSAEGGDADNPSHRDWLKAKGFKSLDDVAKSYREAEHAIRNGGKFTVPGDKAKPDEVEAFHKAIGRPDAPDKYAFETPEGAELDEDLVTPMREVAFKAGVPAPAFKAMAEGLIQSQLDAMEAMKTAENGDAAELLKSWGAQKDAKLADVTTAMRALDINQTDVAAIQRGFAMTYGKPGSARTLGLLQKLGAGMAEDALIGGGGERRFGITGAEAQKEIDQLIVSPEFQAKLSAKEPEAVARWDRLNGAVAAARDAANRAAAA